MAVNGQRLEHWRKRFASTLAAKELFGHNDKWSSVAVLALLKRSLDNMESRNEQNDKSRLFTHAIGSASLSP